MGAPNPALESFLRSIPLFALVEPSEMLDILRLLRPIQLEPGQVLFREGEHGRAMWLLAPPAEVSVSAVQPVVKRSVSIAYARAGETVGEMALIDDGPRSGTATVTVGGPAHQIDAIDFHVLRQSYAPAAFQVLRRMSVDLCRRLRLTSERIVPGSDRVPSRVPVLFSRTPDAAVLDEFPLFAPMPKVVKLALSQKLQLIEVSSITPLFGEGDEGSSAYFLLSGQVNVGRNGKTLTTLGPGSMFGLVAAVDKGTRSASCITDGPARLLELKATDFDALFAARNRFAYQVVDWVARQLVEHLRQANQRLPVAGLRPPPQPGVQAVPALTEEEVLPEAELLPLELEMALSAG